MAAASYLNFNSDFFNKYATLDYYLDKGASGHVFGPIPWHGLQLALKQAMFPYGKVTDEFKARIEVKKDIWTSIKHSHLMRIHTVDLNRLPKAMFIVMEFAAGGSLNKTLRSLEPGNKLPFDVVTEWAQQIADGMLYLHEKNIVHRDLKSSNILLMEPFDIHNSHVTMTLKITDFDEVKEHDHTTTISFVGTCAYMAPEVLVSQRFSKASDVWSFGVVVWEMLSGDIPHKELEQRAIIHKLSNGELCNLPVEQSFPEDYKLLLSRCWESTCWERLTFQEIFCILQQMAQSKDVTETLKSKLKESDNFQDTIQAQSQDVIETLKSKLKESVNFQDTIQESHAIRSNQQFLVENIQSNPLIDLLHEKNCITDEERDHLNKQPFSSYRNDALLHWMRTIAFKEDKGLHVLECFRQTKQNFVADLLVKGGVLIKSKISTKLVKVGLFTKSSSKNVEELNQKEIMVIKKLNQMQGLSLSSIQPATSEIPVDDIVIAPYCHQEADGIAIWFWCQSPCGQRKLQRMYKLGILLGKLITSFKEFSKDRVSSALKVLVPTSINIFVGDFTKNEDELPEQYKSDPYLIGTIRTKAAEEGKKWINGLTILDKELFVVIGRSSEVEVYDSIKLNFSRRWNLKELIDPMDIASCNRNKCIYIFDLKGLLGQSTEILRVDPNGELIKNWSIGYEDGYGLSVTDESNVILTVFNKNKLSEYSPDGQLLREISLSSDAGISFPWHAIALTNGNFVVSHGYGDEDLHRVCIVDAHGKLLKSFGGKRGSYIGEVNRPVYLSVDKNGFVMVADRFNCQVLLLNSDLKFSREILWKEKHELRNPERILLDESNSRILVGDNDGLILIFQFCV